MTHKLAVLFSLACAFNLTNASILFAQLTVSTIRGSATDPSGAVIANAQITITNLGTNISRSTVANDKGDYELSDLPRGTYRLTASTPGFKNFVADNIILETNQIRRIDIAFLPSVTSLLVLVSRTGPSETIS